MQLSLSKALKCNCLSKHSAAGRSGERGGQRIDSSNVDLLRRDEAQWQETLKEILMSKRNISKLNDLINREQ